MSLRHITPLAILGLALGLARPAHATRLELAILAPDGTVTASKSVDLGPGDEGRVVTRWSGHDLKLVVRLSDTSEAKAAITLNGFVHTHGVTVPDGWMSRTYELGPGDAVALSAPIPGTHEAVQFRVHHTDLRLDRPELAPLEVTAALSLIERSDGGERTVERHELHLKSGEWTRVAFESDGGSALVVRLRPRARNAVGVELQVAVSARLSSGDATATDNAQALHLDWGDRIAIDGLTGPAGPARLELACLRPR